jgi:hypothetical protein
MNDLRIQNAHDRNQAIVISEDPNFTIYVVCRIM